MLSALLGRSLWQNISCVVIITFMWTLFEQVQYLQHSQAHLLTVTMQCGPCVGWWEVTMCAGLSLYSGNMQWWPVVTCPPCVSCYQSRLWPSVTPSLSPQTAHITLHCVRADNIQLSANQYQELESSAKQKQGNLALRQLKLCKNQWCRKALAYPGLGCGLD